MNKLIEMIDAYAQIVLEAERLSNTGNAVQVYRIHNAVKDARRELIAYVENTQNSTSNNRTGIFEFAEESIPTFREGPLETQHELEFLVTADRCNQLVRIIDKLHEDNVEMKQKNVELTAELKATLEKFARNEA